jgi:hypothetical protein
MLVFEQWHALRAAPAFKHHLIVENRALGLIKGGVEPRPVALATG